MKKLMIALLLTASVSTVFAQSAQFGIKGGLNFGATGELQIPDGSSFDGENKVGYHLGLLAKFEFAGLFLQPEVAYTRLNSGYEDRSFDNDVDYNLSKLDVPVLLGLNVVGPLNIKAGPSFQYIFNNEIDGVGTGIDIDEPENSFTVGYQLGAGVQLGNLGLDLRYEGAFKENDAVLTSTEVENLGATVDNRPSQWILSVSYIFDGGK